MEYDLRRSLLYVSDSFLQERKTQIPEHAGRDKRAVGPCHVLLHQLSGFSACIM
jgi:hypothetical protein